MSRRARLLPACLALALAACGPRPPAGQLPQPDHDPAAAAGAAQAPADEDFGLNDDAPPPPAPLVGPMRVITAADLDNTPAAHQLVRLAVVLPNYREQYFLALVNAASVQAKRLNAELTVTSPQPGSGAADQAALIRQAATDQYDALLIAPTADSDVLAALHEADQSGLPIIAVGGRPSPEALNQAEIALSGYVGPPDSELGPYNILHRPKTIGKYAVRLAVAQIDGGLPAGHELIVVPDSS